MQRYEEQAAELNQDIQWYRSLLITLGKTAKKDVLVEAMSKHTVLNLRFRELMTSKLNANNNT